MIRCSVSVFFSHLVMVVMDEDEHGIISSLNDHKMLVSEGYIFVRVS